MLAIGRALMADPKLLICDEISLGLAPVAIDALYEALRSVNQQGVAVLLVEQNVHRSLEVAHHATVLSRGRVSYQGDPSKLLNDADLDAAYFGGNERGSPRPELEPHVKSEGEDMCKPTMRRWFPGVVAVALLASACGSGSSSGSTGDGDIVIGASMALSGQINLQQIRDGYQMRIDEVNADGGIKIDGKQRKLVLKVLDNRTDSNTMTQQVRTLALKDGAVALLGSCCQQNIEMQAQADALKAPLVEVALPVELLPKGEGSHGTPSRRLLTAPRASMVSPPAKRPTRRFSSSPTTTLPARAPRTCGRRSARPRASTSRSPKPFPRVPRTSPTSSAPASPPAPTS